MSPGSEALFTAALTLPPAEREELAERLLRSLDEADSATLSPAWKAEIERRLKEIDDGTAELVDGEEVMEWLRSKYEAKAQP
jgi:putative addiction module component (TIGR02574 family)